MTPPAHRPRQHRPRQHRHPALLSAGLLTAGLLLAACGSSSTPTASSTVSTPTPTPVAASSVPTSASGIVIKDFGFTGQLTVRPGERITVTNLDSVAHTLTDAKKHLFDSGNIDPGASGTITAPTAPGRYAFGCTYHPAMAGTLVVSG